jgi:hypothetical protein
VTAARLQKFTLNRRLNGEASTELLALELVPLRIHLWFYLTFLLQDTKQTISLIQGQAGN